MDDCHFRQRISHDESYACAQKIRKNDGGSSQANGDTASQEQTDADGAANGHHGQLPLAQAAVKTFHFRHRQLLAERDLGGGTSLISHSWRIESAVRHFRQRASEPANLFQGVVVHKRRPDGATLFGKSESFHQPRRIHVTITRTDISLRKLFSDSSRRNARKIETQRRRPVRDLSLRA